MIFKINFTGLRKTPIGSKYRPDWTSINKPEHNCAALVFNDGNHIDIGETHICYLHPMRPNLWEMVVVDDVLKCLEGSRQTGEATIIEIIKEKI